MRLFVPLFIFLYFINYITGFEYFNDICCSSINSQDTETLYTHTWLIKDFQDLYNELYNGNKVFSEKFFTPILDNQGEYYGWRTLIIPRWKERECIAIFLVAFQTDYEKENRLDERRATVNIEMYLNNNIEKLESRESLKLLERTETGSHLFLFSKNSISYGNEFCIFSKIFPNGDTSIKTNLIIRIHFYKDDITVSNPNDNYPPKFFEPFGQYFNSDKFSDVIFEFNCGSEIKASSIFLAVKSSHFKKLLEETDERDSKMTIIRMERVSYNCFYKLLYFIYTGKLDNNLTYEELIELYHESNSREINDLREIVSCRIIKFVDEDTWEEILFLGWETKNNLLKQAAMKFASYNWEKIKNTDKFRDVERIEEFFITKLFIN
ncbi:hypothetical protein C1645_811636 [Glomus cerebriforme]|uniref:BTB domain-containing protein n=1 Tax=Glomus cerebriforme TaxID=658196 RepID=A0A397TN66_9GLOM|nr:hypothetical protein C1645_811636 [Glomus cerebriforme]